MTGFGSEASDSSHPGSTGAAGAADTTGDGLPTPRAAPVRPAGAGARPGTGRGPPTGGGGRPPGRTRRGRAEPPARAVVACAPRSCRSAARGHPHRLGMSGGNSGAQPRRSAPATRPPPAAPAAGCAPPSVSGHRSGRSAGAAAEPAVRRPGHRFVLHGLGWRPGTSSRSGWRAPAPRRTSRWRTGGHASTTRSTSRHESPRGAAAGRRTVTVTGSGGQRATVKFDSATATAAGPAAPLPPSGPTLVSARHHRSSCREHQAGSSRRPRSAGVMIACSISTQTTTSSDSRTPARRPARAR